MASDEKYISLKKASEISGYAPDYVGQLIRKGKLPGKQVYHAVAWMTTEKAVREYIAHNKAGKDKGGTVGVGLADRWQRLMNAVRTEAGLLKLFRMMLCAFLVVLAGLALLLFYVFAVNLDKRLEQRALEKLQEKAQEKYLISNP